MSGPLHATISKEQSIVIRRATAVDAGVCGKICFEAFCTIAAQHGFPPDFPSPEIPIHILSTMFSHPGFFCVVAEQEGEGYRQQLPGREDADWRCGADHD